MLRYEPTPPLLRALVGDAGTTDALSCPIATSFVIVPLFLYFIFQITISIFVCGKVIRMDPQKLPR